MHEHDVKIVFGNLNFRLKPGPVVGLSDTNFKEFLARDDLMMHGSKNSFIKQFREGYLSFPPTYKFLSGSKLYDTSQTQAWCDRVLWSTVQPG